MGMSGITPRREGSAMYDEHTATLGGDVKEPIAKPKTHAQKVADWRKENQPAYKEACEAHCTCTPTRAQMLLINQWEMPPV
jgi:hypothetical protein